MPTIFQEVVEVTPAGLDTVTFNDTGDRPPEAQHWGIDVMEGWDETPDVTTYITELGGYRDGDAAGSYFPIRSRYVTVGGYVLAASRSDAKRLYDKIVQAFPRNDDAVLVRREPIVKYLTVRRSGKVESEWPLLNGFRWQTTVVATDPFKYSADLETASAGPAGLSSGGLEYPLVYPLEFTGGGEDSDSAGLVNRGNAPSSHIWATINGPLAKGAWRLRNDTSGEEILFDVGLAAGEVLGIDFAKETATVNGYPISANFSGTFWKLLPGSNTIRLYADFDPSTSFTIETSSAWE